MQKDDIRILKKSGNFTFTTDTDEREEILPLESVGGVKEITPHGIMGNQGRISFPIELFGKQPGYRTVYRLSMLI
ncbi:MAG: hypothetical protein LBS57_01410 [Treponema sp.]|nr:hypothetical protein [Treponema sp.]